MRANLSIPGKTVALLDVGDTLILGNDNLIQALKEKNIIDVYLFTDMVLNPLISEGNQLIADLTQQGLIVHGVITPSDYIWHLKKHLTEEKKKELVQQLDNKKKSLTENENIEKLQDILSEHFPELLDLANGNTRRMVVPGAAFADTETTYDFWQLSLNAKFMADIISAIQQLPHVKGLLLKHFIQYAPPWVQKILIFDDRDEVLQAVDMVKSIPQHACIPIATKKVVPKNNSTKEEFIKFIEDFNEENYQKFYGKLKDNLVYCEGGVKIKLTLLLDTIQETKRKSPQEIERLTEALVWTEALLNGRMTEERYREFARTEIMGRPSPAMKIIGGLMIALGALTIITASAATATGMLAPVGTLGIIGGSALVAFGIGLFCRGRQKGVSKAMDESSRATYPMMTEFSE